MLRPGPLGAVSWGGQSSVMRSGITGPKNPKSSATKTSTWHCSKGLALYDSKRRRDDNKNIIFAFEGGAFGSERKIVQKRCFFSWERHYNKILKVQILLSRNFVVIAQPWPSNPCFFGREKARETPKKARGFPLRGTPQILGKRRSNTPKKQGKSEIEKARKSKKARVGGSVCVCVCAILVAARAPGLQSLGRYLLVHVCSLGRHMHGLLAALLALRSRQRRERERDTVKALWSAAPAKDPRLVTSRAKFSTESEP